LAELKRRFPHAQTMNDDNVIERWNRGWRARRRRRRGSTTPARRTAASGRRQPT
jgi:hypothetical protein